MALVLKLQNIENLAGKSDRLIKATFRGVPHYSKVLENCESDCSVNEVFEWPVARPIGNDELLEIQILNYNKYLSNRLVGSFTIILQQLVEIGRLNITDQLVDANNVVLRSSVSFELIYQAPDGSVGVWSQESMNHGTDTDEHAATLSSDNESPFLLPPNAGGKPRLSVASMKIAGQGALKPPQKALRHVVKLITKRTKSNNSLRKMSSSSRQSSDEEAAAIEKQFLGEAGLLNVPRDNLDDEVNDQSAASLSSFTKKNQALVPMESLSLKAQDYQVCITIIEARQLAGLNMDPVVCVQVGDQKKYTSVKESTNCPYYNEYFVFDFHMAPAMLFDCIITLTVLQSRTFIRSNKLLGSFKLDVGTVYAAQDHQFYHKWAMLTDPDDINGGPKGYLKTDLAVIGKGDSIKVPLKNDRDEDDIEANLLLPDGVPTERQRARIVVKIYRAEGLPKMNTGLMANVKKAFTGESKDLVDPYVQVSFAGHKGKTSVKKGNYEPIWNEAIVFTEMFPPLCRRLKVQLRDSDRVNDDVIGTHFIDLGKISNEREKGFLPTFGPCWLNMYGSTRNYTLIEEHSHLNQGLGEGVSFRGRLLVALKTELLDNSETGPCMVDVEPVLPVPDSSLGRVEEYFLCSVILDCSMIDKKTGDKPIQFEISVGNYGNTIDGQNSSLQYAPDSNSEDDSNKEETDSLIDSSPSNFETTDSRPATEPIKPISRDRYYYYLPYEEDKPCLYVRSYFEDHRRRLYITNVIEKIAEKLEDGLTEVGDYLKQEKTYPESKLRSVLDELSSNCAKFSTLTQAKMYTQSNGRTKLDRERLKMCQRELDQLGTMVRTLRATTTKTNVKEKLKAASSYLNKLRHLAQEPQPSLPDVFVWMIAKKKKVPTATLR